MKGRFAPIVTLTKCLLVAIILQVRHSLNGRRLQSLPSEMGVMRMQYVTYSDLFQFALVITSIISVAVSLHFEHKKK
jgi:hypothetical protein